MHFTYTVEVEVEREQGKFASREEIGDELREAIESANPDEITTDNDAIYVVAEWDVNE